MKYCFVFFSCLYSLSALATPHLVRQWSRSTLVKPHYKFRHLNRMAPLLTETHVIQGNGTNGIKSFNRDTGHEAWQINLFNGVEGGAAADNDRLYFGSSNGVFYCVDIHSGRTLWTFKLNSESLTKPIVVGNFVYHIAGNNTLYSFDKKTGQSIWVKTNSAKANMTVRGQTAPVFDKGIIYVGFSDGNFAAINAQNGRELWRKRIGDDKKFNDVDATAVVTPQCVLVASFANSLYCLNKTSGSILWRHDKGGYNGVFVDNNRVYYSTVDGHIDLLDAQSGKLLKRVINIRGQASQVTGIGPYIVYGETEGELVLRKKGSLEKVASFAPGLGLFARPTVDSEKNEIYFVSNDANLFRFDIQEQKDNPFIWGPDEH